MAAQDNFSARFVEQWSVFKVVQPAYLAHLGLAARIVSSDNWQGAPPKRRAQSSRRHIQDQTLGIARQVQFKAGQRSKAVARS